jgi:hypothetical protein
MKITVVHPGELGQCELARWRSIQRATPSLANPLLSPEFTVAVGRLRSRAPVAVLFDGPEIVGFFPFERRALRYGVPIGAGHNDCQGLVHLADLDWDPLELLRACGLAVWEFDHLVDGETPSSRTRSSAFHRRSWTCPRGSTLSSRSCARAPPDSATYRASSASLRGRWVSCGSSSTHVISSCCAR